MSVSNLKWVMLQQLKGPVPAKVLRNVKVDPEIDHFRYDPAKTLFMHFPNP